MKILLVEDDLSSGKLLSKILKNHHYTIDLATDGLTGLELASQWSYDLYILDVQVPRLDGISLCQHLRTQDKTTPILLLTGKRSNDDVIAGLDAGADDYVLKPFDANQLLARIRALLRRSSTTSINSTLTWGELCLDSLLIQVTYHDQRISLNAKEYSLLELLLRHPQQVFNRSTILDRLWSLADSPSEGAVTNLVKDLRRKLKIAGIQGEVIETLYGLGYRLSTAPQVTSAGIQSNVPAENPGLSPQPVRRSLNIDGRTVMERFKAALTQRLEVLDDALQLLQSDCLTAIDRQRALNEAHRLAGSLGTFGYGQGSDVARRIEQWLAEETSLEGQLTHRTPSRTQQIEPLSHLLNELHQILVRPPTVPNILAASDELEPRRVTPTTPARVLIVDDDPIALAALASLLQPWGLQVTCLVNPDRFWQTLTTTQPDLLLLDLEMPTVSGIELCREVRQNAQYGNLPILVVTAHTDPTSLKQVFAAGGDDLIGKPIVGPELVTRVTSQIERSQLQQQLRELHNQQASQWLQSIPNQAVTYISDRGYFDECLRQEWHASQQESHPLALMFCGVDPDPGGVRIARSDDLADRLSWQQLASTLRNCLKPSDVVAWYETKIIAILLPHTQLSDTLPIAQRIQQEIAHLQISYEGLVDGSYVTVSLGITGTIPIESRSIDSLVATAAQALEAAQQRGRNTYCLYPL